MNYNLFIAKKIAEERGGKVSSLSNKISGISIAISIIVMLIAISILFGFKKEVGDKARAFSGQIIFTAPGQEPMNDLYPINSDFSFYKELKSIRGIESISGIAYSPAMLKTNGQVQGVVFKGVDSLYNLELFNKNIVEGRTPVFCGMRASNEVLISKRLANLMGYNVGDKVIAYFIKEKIWVRSFEIVGLFEMQLEDVDKTFIIADIRHISKINGWTDADVSCLEITLNNYKEEDRVLSKIEDLLVEKSTDDDDAVIVKTVRDIYPHLFDWLDLMDLNVIIVLILMIVVAGFNMISGLLIILFEKISMIGLLKSLGMDDKAIMKIFIYRGSFILFNGLICGNTIALILIVIQKHFKVIALNPSNYFVDSVPVVLDFELILLLNICSIVFMTLIMTVPSFFISKVSPSKTIKLN